MSANVECAGQWIDVTDDGRDDRLYLASCGWEDYRPGLPIAVDGELKWNVLTISNDPCPRCGGKVTLIGQDQETSDA